jgi:tagatose 6-phosphate kinase
MRISTVILSDDGRVTPLFERGPKITPADERALLLALESRPAAPGEWAVVDGAEPPGATPSFFADVCRKLTALGYCVLLDAAGDQLREGLRARPDLVKVNLGEARSAFDEHGDCGRADRARPAADVATEGLGLSRRLVEAGAAEAIVTLGAAGAVGLLANREWRVATPTVAARNTVGSGDCFAAALVLARESGSPHGSALAAAAGAGAANAASELTGHLDADLARALAGRAAVSSSTTPSLASPS